MSTNFWKINAKLLFVAACMSPVIYTPLQAQGNAKALSTKTSANKSTKESSPLIGAKKLNETTVLLSYADQSTATLDFYGDHIFRFFQDPKGGALRNPEATPAAQILVDNPRGQVNKLSIREDAKSIYIETAKVLLQFDKQQSLLSVTNLLTKQQVLNFVKPIEFDKEQVSLQLSQQPKDYFFGGGVQNGRFSHRGKAISIENQNSWTDGGVASPTPYFWSTAGYAVFFHTFKKGTYDFGSKEATRTILSHETDYLDVFFMVNDGAAALLKDFYQLTGNPVLIPKFGFYQGHLNAFNRDYWKENKQGLLFEDGKRYSESQKDTEGIKESLNGELNNYQFSARAVIDRYKNHDMPFGWILPNDGYGAGYGQTSSLDSNIANLKSLGDYARERGVEIGLWTQSDLHPKADIPALLQRDIIKEVKDAGVRVLKTDVAWVGAGYSFGLNGVADVGHVMPKYGNQARPFIISLDGWAGTQRYAGIWSGDQTGGDWEYIRFHIPTYIGSGLSGQPNITSDVDGIFGGKNAAMNTRDFQWKTFTPMELNMDGWGSTQKYPHAFGEPFTSINRNYLKLKAELMPYAYSIAREAVEGLPMIRAMFLEQANDFTLGKATQYQYLYGPSLLVAPIYQATAADTLGNDIRNGIYLPEGMWIDYFSGQQFSGNKVINNVAAPIWKTPTFVKAGAIIPMAAAHNNVHEVPKDQRIFDVYPAGSSSFTAYDDDGRTEAYKAGQGVYTKLLSEQMGDKVTFTILPSTGNFEGFEKIQQTQVYFHLSQAPKSVKATLGKKKLKLKEVFSDADFAAQQNVYRYQSEVEFNRFSTAGSAFAKERILGSPRLQVKLAAADVTTQQVVVEVKGFKNEPVSSLLLHSGAVEAPAGAAVVEADIQAYSLKPSWTKVANADYYEILFQDMLYSTILDNNLLFDNLSPLTDYTFQIRSVNKDGHSAWTTVTQKTKINPLEFAIPAIQTETSVPNQGGETGAKLVDFDESTMWHTAYGEKAVPFDLVLDLKKVNQLDKFHYLPRIGHGNGTILQGAVFISDDKVNWTRISDFEWANTDEKKIFDFAQEKARYIKLSVTKAVGNYGSGRELYVFKVPGTESFLQGDINNNGIIDENDLTSYINYTGLRYGDADFEGYISKGDLNKNQLIDAYDISVVATQLEGGVRPAQNNATKSLAGSIKLSANKTQYAAGESVEITVSGKELQAVNALSFALPYASSDFEFVEIVPLQMKQLQNLTNDRLHKNGQKAIYATFVNVGQQETLAGSNNLFVIRLKAKKQVTFKLKAIDGVLVDKYLNSLAF